MKKTVILKYQHQMAHYLPCVSGKPMNKLQAATTNGGSMMEVTMSVQQVHERLVHINERMTKEIANSLGWKLTGSDKLNCASCAAGKAKQKSLKKVSVPDPNDKVNGYRAYLEISTVKKNEKYPVLSNLN